MTLSLIQNTTLSENILLISKIIVISFIFLFLIGNFTPYFEGKDAKIYGNVAINLAEGKYSITNEFLQKTGMWEFMPTGYVKTIDNEAVPGISIGLPLIASLAFLIGGENGLFFLNPILTTLLLIVSERISSKFFGKYVGFLVLLMIATNIILVSHGQELLGESIFSILLILGVFYLISFMRFEKPSHLFFASSIFAFATLIRINGLIFFPIEIIILSSLVLWKIIQNRKQYSQTSENQVLSFKDRINLKKLFFKISFLLIPWLIFLVFWFSYNDYYFGDPLNDYTSVFPPVESDLTPNDSKYSIFSFDTERFNLSKGYSKFLLPSIFLYLENPPQNYFTENSLLNPFFESLRYLFANQNLGLLSFFVIIISLIISFKRKTKQAEILVFSFFSLGFVWFYSASFFQLQINYLPGRWIIPVFPLFSMMIGFVIQQIWFSNNLRKPSQKIRIWRIIIIVFLILFFVASFANSYVQLFQEKIFNFNYPVLSKNFDDGISKGVLLTSESFSTYNTNLIPLYPHYNQNGEQITSKTEFPERARSTLQNLLEENYPIYILKKEISDKNKPFLENLVYSNEYEITEFNEKICMVKKIDVLNKNLILVDPKCLNVDKLNP